MGLGNRNPVTRHAAGVISEEWWAFEPGDRVLVTEGFLGTVESVEDGPHPGSESYQVVLDGGMGGGDYASGELSGADSPPKVAKTAAVVTSEQHEADLDQHVASEDYPILTDILQERLPLEHATSAIGFLASKTASNFQVVDDQGQVVAGPFDNSFKAQDEASANPAHSVVVVPESQDTSFDDGWAAGGIEGFDNVRAEAGWVQDKVDRFSENTGYKPGNNYSVDWCRFRRNEHCFYPRNLNAQATAQAGYEVWVPEDRGYCPRRSWEDQRVCPAPSQPGPKSNHPQSRSDATVAWEDGGQRSGSVVPVTITSHKQADPGELDWHFTAGWKDVQTKAKSIKDDGHVRILSATDGYVVGEVRGSANIYQARLMRAPGSQSVAMWECGCAWANYSWARSGRWKKYEGRMCSHALALNYEAQSRGMFGKEVAVDRMAPKWRNDPTVPVILPGDARTKPGPWRVGSVGTGEGIVPGARVEVTTGINHYGRQGTVESLTPYAKGTLAQVRFRYWNERRDFDVRELRLVTASVDEKIGYWRTASLIVRLAEIDPSDPEAGMRKVLEECESSDHTHSGVIIKSLDSGRVLMTQRAPSSADAEDVYGRWEFPGGGIEDGETAWESAQREFTEETGLQLPTGSRVVDCYSNGPYLAIIVLVANESWSNQANLLDFECMGVGWFDPDQIDGSDLARAEVDKTEWDIVREAVRKEAAWQDQAIRVEGLSWKLGWFWGGKLYHGSATKLAAGTVLKPGHGKNFKQSGNAVSITSDPSVAMMWARDVAAGEAHVYEVEPLSVVGAHRVSFHVMYEGRVEQARIIREVPSSKIVSSDREMIEWQKQNPQLRWRARATSGPPPWVKVAVRKEALPRLKVNPTVEDVVDWYSTMAKMEEPKASRDMQQIANEQGGIMAGFRHRVKAPNSVADKIRLKAPSRMKQGVPPDEWISDPLRYTFTFHPADYGAAVRDTLYALEERNYDVVGNAENSWKKGDSYSGMHFAVRTPNGLLMELQFHTAQSFLLKQKTLHKMYEEFRKASTPLRRRQELWEKMTRYWDDVDIPKDVMDWPTQQIYRKPLSSLNPHPISTDPDLVIAPSASLRYEADIKAKVRGIIRKIKAIVGLDKVRLEDDTIVSVKDVQHPDFHPTRGISGFKARQASVGSGLAEFEVLVASTGKALTHVGEGKQSNGRPLSLCGTTVDPLDTAWVNAMGAMAAATCERCVTIVRQQKVGLDEWAKAASSTTQHSFMDEADPADHWGDAESHVSDTPEGGEHNGPKVECPLCKTAGVRDTPSEQFGLRYDPSLERHPEVLAAKDFDGWDGIPIVSVDAGALYATEAMLSSSSINKVVSGGEALRSGYDAFVLKLSDGREALIDGHHRAAMAAMQGRPLKAHVLDASSLLAVGASTFDTTSPFGYGDGWTRFEPIREDDPVGFHDPLAEPEYLQETHEVPDPVLPWSHGPATFASMDEHLLFEGSVEDDAVAMLTEGYEAGLVEADALSWFSPNDAGQSVALERVGGPEATLNDEPEPALPTTDAEAPVEAPTSEQPVIAPDWLSPGGGTGNGRYQSSIAANTEIAAMASLFLKEGAKAFSVAEQQVIINEGAGGVAVASNLDRLDITGTHYEALEQRDTEDDGWLL